MLSLVLRGLDSGQISVALTIAPTTAEDHLRDLLAKTGTPARSQLVLRALGGTP